MVTLADNERLHESELVNRCAQGDRHSFDELWERYRKRILYYFHIRAAGEANEAEDLLQETFIRAWAAVTRGTNVTSFKAWLYSIAKNVMADWGNRRRNTGVHAPLPLEEHEDEPAPDPSTEDLVEARLSYEFLIRQLDNVLISNTKAPAGRRIGLLRKMAFMSFYVDGMTLPQIREELAIHARSLREDPPTLTQLNNWLSRGDILAALVRHLLVSHPELVATATQRCLSQLSLRQNEIEIARLRWQEAMPLETIADRIGISLQDVASSTERIAGRLIPMVTASIKGELHEFRKES